MPKIACFLIDGSLYRSHKHTQNNIPATYKMKASCFVLLNGVTNIKIGNMPAPSSSKDKTILLLYSSTATLFAVTSLLNLAC